MMIDTTGIEGPVVDVIARFRAPREKVFQTWTDPKLIPKWFMAAPGYLPALCEVTLEPLGRWSITVRPSGDVEPSLIGGHFFHVRADRELAYSWNGNIPGGEYHTLVDVRFEDAEDGNGSQVRLTHGVFRSDADRQAHAEGWNLCLDGLARVLGEETSS